MSDHESVPRYPLEWPVGWVRTQPHRRQRSSFRTKHSANGQLSVMQATGRLEGEVDRLGGLNAVLSTNVSLRLDGRPRSSEDPKDPGVALYFSFKGKATVFACDRFTTVADNIAAIAGHIDALRRVERYGVGSLEQALSGYKALPADTAANWRAVFGFAVDQHVTLEALDTVFKDRARVDHPDHGGTHEAMLHLNRARDFAQTELEAR